MRRLTFALILLAAPLWAAEPIFENRTPVGFVASDSTTTQDFVSGATVGIRVDLNQPVTDEFPLIGHFHSLERSEQLSTTDTDGSWVDVAMVDVAPFGTLDNIPAEGVTQAASLVTAIHMAWIEASTNTTGPIFTGGTTPAYEVYYARSEDGGATFSTPISVSGGLSYHALTVDVTGNSFSTLDLEVDSGGNPRLAYAFVTTADRSANRNIYFTYSSDGGDVWEAPVAVNDVTTVGTEGRASAFPRMVIDDRDEIFIAYERGTSTAAGDIMLTKVNRTTSPFSMEAIGSLGTTGSAGGVRLTPDAKRHTGVDLALGDDDALHAVYFSDADDRVEHKRLATDSRWLTVSSAGWDQDADGATVGSFVDEVAGNAALDVDANFFFPSVVVDRLAVPDRVYSVYKYADNTPVEAIHLNQYVDSGTTGSGAVWGTASTAWSTGTTALFADGLGEYGPELDWFHTERVAAFVDDRLEDHGDLHIAFSAGYSGSTGDEHDIYMATYNGRSWTLPEKVADVNSDGAGTEDGIANTDVYLGAPALTHHRDSANLFLAFIGGTGEGYGINGVSNVNHHPYFKVLGRDITVEDQSVPVGAYEYTLTYTPVNPQTPLVERADRPVWVHAADPTDGTGLGADGQLADGFLAGTWERVGTSLQDTQKRYEGLKDESTGDSREWGDDDDKVGLLVKLNVLASDSATNLQVITSSSAAARSLSVATAPFVSLTTGSFFQLGADIDIVATNTAPTVSISDPNGVSDTANTSYVIRYDLNDSDDDLSGTLNAAFYAYSSPGLKSVQDIRIFATLIADQNDVSARNANGTDDLTEGTNQTYTWDDPPAALQSGSLFASIHKVRSASYYIYLVAEDANNQPVFAVSPGPVTIAHTPVIVHVDPSAADTVDTGVRTGLQASPYDFDFTVVDFDSEARVQLFYSAISGLTSVSVSGAYPNQRFVLGKSQSGVRGTAITATTTLSSHEHEFDWDVRTPLIPQGAYYLYAVASDGTSVTVGNSANRLVVRHSPRFTFYEPARNTQRSIDSGSQPVYTIQWQKGPGDADLDDDATIAFYFTSVDPVTKDYSGTDPTSLLNVGDGDGRLIVSGLSENGEGAGDLYTWDLRQPPNEIPDGGKRVWLYAVLDDGNGNQRVSLGGSLVITHSPYILLTSSLPKIGQGDIVRLNWDDYMVDDGTGTDDAYIRLYASRIDTYSTLSTLEANVIGSGGGDEVYLINSSDGTASGTIDTVREDSSNTFRWDTRTPSFELPEGVYAVYAGISADATFSGNTTGRISTAPNELVVTPYSGTSPNLGLSPNRLRASVGDTLRFDVLVQSSSLTATVVSSVIAIDANLFDVVNPTSPFTDAGEVFALGTVIEDTTLNNQIRFTKQDLGGEIIGSGNAPLRLAQFALVVKAGFSGLNTLKFDADEANLSLSGSSVPLNASNGMSTKNALIEAVPRGRIVTTVLLEGRAPPIGTGDHSSLLDIHLRLPGSTVDLTDATFKSANDDDLTSADTVEVNTTAAGTLTLEQIPPGRYVLTVKDTSHLSGRTDTLTIRAGETIGLNGARLYASDLRGDPSLLLGQDGHRLLAGDVTEDNEIDEDDVNAIDAAWGSNPAATRFAQADVNNDGRVGVEDLAVVISNISSLTGFGAPPVFKAAEQGQASLELRAPGHRGRPWRALDEVDLIFSVTGVQDLAAYDLQVEFDEGEIELVEGAVVDVGRVFSDNPGGWFARTRIDRGSAQFAAARRGRGWSAQGEGELVRLRIRLHQDGFPSSLKVTAAKLLSSQYAATQLELAQDPRLLATPTVFSLGPNHPNPFNPSTVISYEIPAPAGSFTAVPVSVAIYNALGQRVRDLVREPMTPGFHRTTWDGRDDQHRALGTGVYFYQVRVGQQQKTGKMTMLQ